MNLMDPLVLLENAAIIPMLQIMSQMSKFIQLITKLLVIADLLPAIQDKLLYNACFHVLTVQVVVPNHLFA